MKIAILTTPGNWFIEYIHILETKLKEQFHVTVFFQHEDINNTYDTIFILSYHRIIPKQYLQMHTYNLVVHASALPKGKGWAPFFWQVIEGKSEIYFTLFEASENVDDGVIYLQKNISLTGYELYDELRQIQAQTTMDICLDFIKHHDKIKVKKQIGSESFYKKRTLLNSELDINKTIAEQFNLLRTVSNEEFPAFFIINGRRYLLKIEHDTRGDLR